MRVTARFAGRCRVCLDGFREGDRIDWSPGVGASCLSCAGGEVARDPDPGSDPGADARTWAAIQAITRGNRRGVGRADSQRPDAIPLAECREHGFRYAPGAVCVACHNRDAATRGLDLTRG